jgi:hypothetical protein
MPLPARRYELFLASQWTSFKFSFWNYKIFFPTLLNWGVLMHSVLIEICKIAWCNYENRKGAWLQERTNELAILKIFALINSAKVQTHAQSHGLTLRSLAKKGLPKKRKKKNMYFSIFTSCRILIIYNSSVLYHSKNIIIPANKAFINVWL